MVKIQGRIENFGKASNRKNVFRNVLNFVYIVGYILS
jgi:hypothetical protein